MNTPIKGSMRRKQEALSSDTSTSTVSGTFENFRAELLSLLTKYNAELSVSASESSDWGYVYDLRMVVDINNHVYTLWRL